MDTSGEAAEQIVRMSLQGTEMVLRLSGAGTKHLAAGLIAVAANSEQTKGKTRLASLLKSGKELKVFQLEGTDLKRFAEEAKKYGVLYAVIKDNTNKETPADIMVRAEDASKINRILDKLDLGKVDSDKVTSVVDDIKKERKTGEPDAVDIGVEDKAEAEKLLDELLLKPIQKEPEQKQDPLVQAAEKSPPSEPTSKKKSLSGKAITDKAESRESVRAKIQEIERKRKEVPAFKTPEKKPQQITHQTPSKAKNRQGR